MAPPSATPPPAPPVAWTVPAHMAAAFLLGVTATLLTERILWQPAAPAEWGRPYQIDLNTAPVGELRQLPGVGPTLAERIADARPIAATADLRTVSGIGPTTAAKLRPHVQSAGEAEWAATASRKIAIGEPPIDVNTAEADELMRLPGIGTVLAQRIIAARQERPFRELSDMRRVSGIGVKTLEKLRPFVRFGEAE